MAAGSGRRTAILYDGSSGRRHEVGFHPGNTSLMISDRSGRPVAEWPWAGIEPAEALFPDRPLRLRHRDGGEARLVVGDPEAIAGLVPRIPALARRDHRDGRPWLKIPVLAAACAMVVAVWITGLPRLVEPAATLVPFSWEFSLGKRVVVQAMTWMTGTGDDRRWFCSTPDGDAALAALVDRLVAGVDMPGRLVVQVADTPGVVNAFAAPGGQVILLSGLVTKAGSAEAVAGVLAHEIGHVIGRHPVESLIRAAGLSVLFGALTTDTGSTGAQALGAGALLLDLSHSRDDESEADEIAVRLLNAANIRGDGLADFFAALAEDSGEYSETATEIQEYLSTHPVSADRAEAIRNSVTGTGEAMSATEWQAFRSICGGS